MNRHVQHTNRRFEFPMIGHRILKTALAVFICLLIHMARGFDSGASESCITAIICMQPYAKETRKSAIERLFGTTVGGLWGLIFLLLVTRIPSLPMHMLAIYVLISLGVVVAVYSCVVLHISESAALSAIVFICLVINYPKVNPSLAETLISISDTIIGVLVAAIVNTFHIPTRKRTDRIFFLQLHHLAVDRYSAISPYVLTELNRLYDAGARICLETEYAPAFLIGQLQLLHINLPVIVLGGAALYDIRENMYLEVQAIPTMDAYYLYKMIEALGCCGMVFTLRENSMMLFQIGERNAQEEEDYCLMRRSPYRNYLDGMFGSEDRVLAFRMIMDEEQGDAFERRLNGNLVIAQHFHTVRISRPNHPGDCLFYFYRKGVTVEAAQQKLLDLESRNGEEKPAAVRIYPQSRRYDPEYDAIHLLHRIKHMYQEPLWVRSKREQQESS
ncbi:MAG: aromatic acid exporter family protein [Lachnospiraceae bacterium]|nr:aromatic acid exporter family protein [Lachnospiraceae bacterium]